jgi:hypothetical protein
MSSEYLPDGDEQFGNFASVGSEPYSISFPRLGGGDSVMDWQGQGNLLVEGGMLDGIDITPIGTTGVTVHDYRAAFDETGGNLRQTARRLGINHQTSTNIATELGLPIGPDGRPSVVDDKTWEIIEQRYKGGEGRGKLADKFGIDEGTIGQHMTRAGIFRHK